MFLRFRPMAALKVNSRCQEGVTVTRFSDDRGKLVQDQWPGYWFLSGDLGGNEVTIWLEF